MQPRDDLEIGKNDRCPKNYRYTFLQQNETLFPVCIPTQEVDTGNSDSSLIFYIVLGLCFFVLLSLFGYKVYMNKTKRQKTQIAPANFSEI